MRRAVIAERASRSGAVDRQRLALGALATAHAVADRSHRKQLQTETLAANEIADEIAGRMFEKIERGAELSDAALVHDRDRGRQPQRLLDVVGHEDDRLLRRPVDPREFALQRVAGDRVDRGKGLVHQQQLGIGGECAGYADALLLAAR